MSKKRAFPICLAAAATVSWLASSAMAQGIGNSPPTQFETTALAKE